MKKNIKIILVTVFIFSLVLVSLGQRQGASPVEFRKISERLFEITGGQGASGGAYVGDNGILIIDAKMDKNSVEQVIKGIKKITDKPIKHLVNTHSDGDHVTGNRYFPKSVTIIAHENCRKEFFVSRNATATSEWQKPELAPFVPSVTFREKMDIYLGTKKVELYYFGVGHTTGDTVVYFGEEKTAFLGDQVFLARVPLIHSYKGGNSFEHVKTLSKMLETIDAEKFCSGHSEMTDRAGIRNAINQMKKRQEKVNALMADGKNLDQIKSEFDQSEAGLIETIYNEIKARSRE